MTSKRSTSQKTALSSATCPCAAASTTACPLPSTLGTKKPSTPMPSPQRAASAAGERTRPARSSTLSSERLNTTPASPHSSPSSKKSGSAVRLGAAKNGRVNTGVCPARLRVTVSATVQAISAAVNTIGVKSRCSSSSTKVTPASGALKAAASPAPAPAAIRVRRRCGRARVSCATAAPRLPPICTLGPSRPSGSPDPIASSPPTNLTGSTRGQGKKRSRCSTALSCGMPLPEALGSARRTSQTLISSPIIGASTISAGVQVARRSSKVPSSSRKAVTSSPTSAPVRMAPT